MKELLPEIVDLQISHLYKNERKNQKDMKSLTFFNWQLKKHKKASMKLVVETKKK